MVAKSYENLEVLSEPYSQNGRMYIQVRMKNGNSKAVRWYTEAEYAKMYGSAATAEAKEKSPFGTQHDILGFQKGYITIFKGDTYSCLTWFHQSIARYCRYWGWYIVSTEEMPEELPFGIEPVRLDWDKVGNEDGTLKLESEISAYVDSLIYEPSESNFVGEKGERLELILTIKRNIPLENSFGSATMHIMEDEDKNVFVWTTSAKSWDEGSIHHLRGTVKEHKTYKNDKQTVLTRCTEVK